MDSICYAVCEGNWKHIPAAGNTVDHPAACTKRPVSKNNGWMQLLNSGSFLLGPVIGASLYAIFPMSVVLMSDVAGGDFSKCCAGCC